MNKVYDIDKISDKDQKLLSDIIKEQQKECSRFERMRDRHINKLKKLSAKVEEIFKEY